MATYVFINLVEMGDKCTPFPILSGACMVRPEECSPRMVAAMDLLNAAKRTDPIAGVDYEPIVYDVRAVAYIPGIGAAIWHGDDVTYRLGVDDGADQH